MTRPKRETLSPRTSGNAGMPPYDYLLSYTTARYGRISLVVAERGYLSSHSVLFTQCKNGHFPTICDSCVEMTRMPAVHNLRDTAISPQLYAIRHPANPCSAVQPPQYFLHTRLHLPPHGKTCIVDEEPSQYLHDKTTSCQFCQF